MWLEYNSSHTFKFWKSGNQIVSIWNLSKLEVLLSSPKINQFSVPKKSPKQAIETKTIQSISMRIDGIHPWGVHSIHGVHGIHGAFIPSAPGRKGPFAAGRKLTTASTASMESKASNDPRHPHARKRKALQSNASQHRKQQHPRHVEGDDHGDHGGGDDIQMTLGTRRP